MTRNKWQKTAARAYQKTHPDVPYQAALTLVDQRSAEQRSQGRSIAAMRRLIKEDGWQAQESDAIIRYLAIYEEIAANEESMMRAIHTQYGEGPPDDLPERLPAMDFDEVLCAVMRLNNEASVRRARR